MTAVHFAGLGGKVEIAQLFYEREPEVFFSVSKVRDLHVHARLFSFDPFTSRSRLFPPPPPPPTHTHTHTHTHTPGRLECSSPRCHSRPLGNGEVARAAPPVHCCPRRRAFLMVLAWLLWE